MWDTGPWVREMGTWHRPFFISHPFILKKTDQGRYMKPCPKRGMVMHMQQLPSRPSKIGFPLFHEYGPLRWHTYYIFIILFVDQPSTVSGKFTCALSTSQPVLPPLACRSLRLSSVTRLPHMKASQKEGNIAWWETESTVNTADSTVGGLGYGVVP